MTAASKSIALPDMFKDAMALVARVNALKVIKTKSEYEAAKEDYKTLIVNEKKLKIQFDELEIVKEYEKVYAQYQTLKADFATAKKYINAGPLKVYDDEQLRILAEKQAAADKKAREEAAAETARLMAEQKAIYDANEKERKRLEAIAAKTKDAEKRAQAEDQARQASERAEAAKQEALAVKADAAAAPPATVILESEHKGVTRRKVYRYRLTAKDGRKFLKADLATSVRLGIKDLGPLPAHLFVLSPVLLNDYVDQQGEAASIPGLLEIRSDMV